MTRARALAHQTKTAGAKTRRQERVPGKFGGAFHRATFRSRPSLRVATILRLTFANRDEERIAGDATFLGKTRAIESISRGIPRSSSSSSNAPPQVVPGSRSDAGEFFARQRAVLFFSRLVSPLHPSSPLLRCLSRENESSCIAQRAAFLGARFPHANSNGSLPYLAITITTTTIFRSIKYFSHSLRLFSDLS